jgi:tetratricopeptide (TPR) repeat protein
MNIGQVSLIVWSMSLTVTERIIPLIFICLLLLLGYIGPVPSQSTEPSIVSAASQEQKQPVSLSVDHTARLMQLKLLADQGQWKVLYKEIGEVTGTLTETPEFCLLKVAACQAVGDHVTCQSTARYYLEQYPNHSGRDQVLYFLATSLFQSDQLEEAQQYLDQAEALTKDPILKSNIQQIRQQKGKLNRVGIRLGGIAPEGTVELHLAQQVEVRILQLALELYAADQGKYPDRLEQLLDGNPPILRNLPEDPIRPGETFPYRIKDASYVIEVAPIPESPVPLRPATAPVSQRQEQGNPQWNQ